MAIAASFYSFMFIRSFLSHSATKNPLLCFPQKPTRSPPRLSYPSTIVFSLNHSTNDSVTPSNNHKKILHSNDAAEEDSDEDAFETLFRHLEEDLQNDDHSSNDSEDEMNEEELVKLEQELTEAVGDDELLKSTNSTLNDSDVEEDDKEESPIILKTWQLRRLASALKIGRRKTNIKSLAGDVCLDRAVVLKLLRKPPPKLLLMSAALPDKPEPENVIPETQLKEIPKVKQQAEASKPKAKVNVPIHVLRKQWDAKKRIKKVQLGTLEKVYRRTKRPTGAMVSSIVHVTNLPRKKVVKWFEDKRNEDGLPTHYLPHRWMASSSTVPSN